MVFNATLFVNMRVVGHKLKVFDEHDERLDIFCIFGARYQVLGTCTSTYTYMHIHVGVYHMYICVYWSIYLCARY